jgi:hypothetical protein
MSSNRHELVRQVDPALRPYLQTYRDRWSVAGLHAGTDLASRRSAAGSVTQAERQRRRTSDPARWDAVHTKDLLVHSSGNDEALGLRIYTPPR